MTPKPTLAELALMRLGASEDEARAIRAEVREVAVDLPLGVCCHRSPKSTLSIAGQMRLVTKPAAKLASNGPLNTIDGEPLTLSMANAGGRIWPAANVSSCLGPGPGQSVPAASPGAARSRRGRGSRRATGAS